MLLLIRLRDGLAGAGVRFDELSLRELLKETETLLVMATSCSGRRIEVEM